MRIKPESSTGAVRLAKLLTFLFVIIASRSAILRVSAAQNPDDLLPAPSAAKAKAILEQAVTALGGSAYLNLRNSDCTGRAAQFEHSGGIGDYLQFHDYKEMPDKNRMEYGAKGNIVDLYSGSQGWALDRGGVSEIPAAAMADYQEALKTDLHTILRYRLNDDTLTFRYGGSDVVDLKEADWVEILDREGHIIRMAFDKKTSLPIRTLVTQRDPETGDRIQRGTYYTSYHLIAGIQTAFQISRFRNDRQTYQIFYESCQYNTGGSPDRFTRASLDAYFAATKKNGKGNKK